MKLSKPTPPAPAGSSISLPRERNVPKPKLEDYSVLLYGLEKIGKTSLAAQFPDAFFLMCEPGGKALEIYSREVMDWKQFLGYIDLLDKDRSRFRTIVVDTADRCFKMCEEAVLQRLLIKHASDEDYGKGWAMIKDEFARAIVKLLKLGRGVIFTSHSIEKEIKSRDGQRYDRIVPTMAKGAREILEPIVDIWAYMEYDNTGQRVLHLRGDTHLAAGHRLQDRFVGVSKIHMGKSAKEGYANFVAAFNNTAPSLEKEQNQKPKLKLRR